MDDITTTVESSEATVKAVRQEIPLGGGEAVQRIPYSAALQRLLEQGATSHVIASTTRCIRVVELPTKGGGTAKFHCSKACVGVAGQQLCPDHDKSAFAPSQTSAGPKPEVVSSASIHLTDAELAEMGVTEPQAKAAVQSATVRAREASKSPPAPKPKPKPGRPRKEDLSEGVTLTLALEDFNSGVALSKLIAGRLVAALDQLPATTIARMKEIVALQDRINLWGGAK